MFFQTELGILYAFNTTTLEIHLTTVPGSVKGPRNKPSQSRLDRTRGRLRRARVDLQGLQLSPPYHRRDSAREFRG